MRRRFRQSSFAKLAFAPRARDARPSLAPVLDMTVIPDTNSSPTLAERWIKANIAAAIVAGLASFAVYAVKQAAGAADAGAGALFILYLAAVVFSGLSGAAGGVLTGAVLQRIVRRLPARTWIVLHAAMSSGAGLAVEMMDAARGDRTGEAVALDPGLLPSSIVFGALMGALAGGPGARCCAQWRPGRSI
jgi:hypothetical protein